MKTNSTELLRPNLKDILSQASLDILEKKMCKMGELNVLISESNGTIERPNPFDYRACSYTA